MVKFGNYVVEAETSTYRADCGHVFNNNDTVYVKDGKLFCSKDCLLEYLFRGFEYDEIDAPKVGDTGYLKRHVSYVKGA